MQYSVVIPTNRSITSLLPTLQSLQTQTVPATKILIVYDKILTQHDYDSMLQVIHQNLQAWMIDRIAFITHLTHEFEPHKGVSYLRNMWILHTKTDYILCIDDDNTVSSDFVERLLSLENDVMQKYRKHPLIMPTEYHKNSIRSRGYRGFSYVFGVPIPYHEQKWFSIGDEFVGEIQFCSSNCLFAHQSIFKDNLFDESIPFVYEDFCMTAAVYRKNIPVLVAHGIIVNHHMRNKNPLEDSYISTPTYAYQKAKNRIIFVHTLWNSFQTWIYLLLGIHIHTLALIAKIVWHAPTFGDGRQLVLSIMKGTWAWLFHR